jgi:hypothetical protein
MSVGLFHQYYWSQQLAVIDLTPRRPATPLTIYPWAATSQLLYPRRPGKNALRLDPEHERRKVIAGFIEQALEIHEAEISARDGQAETMRTNLQYGRLLRELNAIRRHRQPQSMDRTKPPDVEFEKALRRVQKEAEQRDQERQDRRKRDNRVRMAKVRAHKELK